MLRARCGMKGLGSQKEVFGSACESTASFSDAEETLRTISSPALLGEI